VASSPLTKDQPYRNEKPAGYFAGVHLGNSGSEANETAIKYARIYASRKPVPNGTKILAFKNSFHGRTMGALSCTWTEKYRLPSGPLVPGVEFIEFNDITALETILSTDFCAVIVEPIQGEGGLCPMAPGFAKKLNELCRKLDVCLIADEIQTGLGRTGTLFASQALGLEPDIVSLAKPLAGGLPASATLVVPKIHEAIHAGDHGGTFGGNPVACALANVVWDEVTNPAFLGKVNELSTQIRRGIDQLREKHPSIGPERGKGMLIGVEILGSDGKAASPDDLARLVVNAREEGLIVLRSGVNVLRMAPPLTISAKDADEGIKRLSRALSRFENYKPT
jgi:acetylornithine/N-succinyldiaminopimelate aminotransferase